MRSEQEMFDLIITTAQQDERIRAVLLNGSRANPNAPHDFFQDFDIVYVVTEMEPYQPGTHWIDRLGELMILQLPDDFTGASPAADGRYGYLMQFMDGNRIDLTFVLLEKICAMPKDSQTKLLLDKDGLFPLLPPASDEGYLVKPPTAKLYFECCNEFWWVSPYAAKGLWRQEITNAKAMQDWYVREQLMKMIDWYVGIRTNFSLSTGKYGKYLPQYLEPALWELLLQTYSGASYEDSWRALFVMTDLFRRVAIPVAEHFGYPYLYEEDARVSAHLKHVYMLPRDAPEMYS